MAGLPGNRDGDRHAVPVFTFSPCARGVKYNTKTKKKKIGHEDMKTENTNTMTVNATDILQGIGNNALKRKRENPLEIVKKAEGEIKTAIMLFDPSTLTPAISRRYGGCLAGLASKTILVIATKRKSAKGPLDFYFKTYRVEGGTWKFQVGFLASRFQPKHVKDVALLNWITAALLSDAGMYKCLIDSMEIGRTEFFEKEKVLRQSSCREKNAESIKDLVSSIYKAASVPQGNAFPAFGFSNLYAKADALACIESGEVREDMLVPSQCDKQFAADLKSAELYSVMAGYCRDLHRLLNSYAKMVCEFRHGDGNESAKKEIHQEISLFNARAREIVLNEGRVELMKDLAIAGFKNPSDPETQKSKEVRSVVSAKTENINRHLVNMASCRLPEVLQAIIDDSFPPGETSDKFLLYKEKVSGLSLSRKPLIAAVHMLEDNKASKKSCCPIAVYEGTGKEYIPEEFWDIQQSWSIRS
jgi:hypothetical protein